MSGQWQIQQDPASGRPYWSDGVNTTWENPYGHGAPSQPPPPPPPGGGQQYQPAQYGNQQPQPPYGNQATQGYGVQQPPPPGGFPSGYGGPQPPPGGYGGHQGGHVAIDMNHPPPPPQQPQQPVGWEEWPPPPPPPDQTYAWNAPDGNGCNALQLKPDQAYAPSPHRTVPLRPSTAVLPPSL